MKQLRERANALRDDLIALRREFHQYPELGLREYRTASRVEQELDKLGIAHRRVGETGVWAALRGEGAGGGAVLLRADIDALPIQERTDCPCRSRNEGVMHACGHDAHTACLLGTTSTAHRLISTRRRCPWARGSTPPPRWTRWRRNNSDSCTFS